MMQCTNLIIQSTGMRMTDPRPSFSHVVSELAKRHPNLSYIHLIESRVTGIDDRESESWEVCSRLYIAFTASEPK